MDKLLTFISQNPLYALAIGFFLLLVVYFVFKQFVKIFLILLIILLAIGGYHYLKDPDRPIQDIVPSAKTTIDKTIETKDKLQEMWHKLKQLFGQGTDLLKERKLLPPKEEEKAAPREKK